MLLKLNLMHAWRMMRRIEVLRAQNKFHQLQATAYIMHTIMIIIIIIIKIHTTLIRLPQKHTGRNILELY